MGNAENLHSDLIKEDNELIASFTSGDREAFDALVLKYKDRVFNICYRFVTDYDEANDCAQEVFLKVYRSLKGFKFKSTFSTWLYSITINTCKNKVASAEYRMSKRSLRLDEPVKTEDDDVKIELKDPKPLQSDMLDRKNAAVRIEKAIDSLPGDQKAVVILRDIEGLSYEEISATTGFNLGTVKSKLSRAREALREKLKGLA